MSELLNRILHKIAFFGPGGYGLRPQIHRLRGARIGKDVWIGYQALIGRDVLDRCDSLYGGRRQRFTLAY